MKKTFSLLMTLVLVAAMFTGCGKKEDSKAADPAASQEGTDSAKKGLYPAIAKDDIIIGVIHITDPAEGAGYTYTHDRGIQGMQKRLE